MELNESLHLLYLPKSGNTYYFRGYILADLIEHFDGVKEFRIFFMCAIKSRAIQKNIESILG